MTAPEPLPRIAVLLDFGAASPMSILAAAHGLAGVTFLADRTAAYVAPLVEELAALAPVCDTAGLSDAEILGRPECRRLDGITTFSERQINRTARLADRLGLPFLSLDSAQAVTDKYRQRRALAEAGIQDTACRVVRTAGELDDALDEVGLPAMLKPRHGAASARTCQVGTRQAARARFADFSAAAGAGSGQEFVLERLLDGDPAVAGAGWADYVSVESVTVDGRTEHIEVTGKLPLAPPARETGYVVPSTLDSHTRTSVLELTTAALAALGVRHGMTHVEVKLTPDGPRIIEVNGRLGGYVADLVRRARGVDLVRLALAASLGRRCEPAPAVYRRHTFQYFLAPPMEAVALRRLDGVEELARHGRIQLVETFRQPGEPLDWRDGTLAYLAIVYGSGTDHPDILRTVEHINRTLRVEYEFGSG